MRRLALFPAMLALAGALSPAIAIPPPLPVKASYGPLTQCLEDYRVVVSREEAVSVGQDVTLIDNRFLLRLVALPDFPDTRKWVGVVHPGLGAIDRLVDGKDRSVRYRLPAAPGRSPIVALSPQFAGTDADFALLSRIARVDPAADACGAIDRAVDNPGALRWSAVPVSGPAYRCQNGIGYPVEAGEQLWLYWGPTPDRTISELHRTDYSFGVRGPIDPARRIGKALLASGYEVTTRPISTDSSELILSPPRNDPQRPFLRQVYIQHLNAREAEARAFAARLEFVGEKDRRCRADKR